MRKKGEGGPRVDFSRRGGGESWEEEEGKRRLWQNNRFRDFFPVPNFSDTGTKFFRYRFREFYRFQFVPIPVPVRHTLVGGGGREAETVAE